MVKRSGVKTSLHICGSTLDRLESMAQTGVDCLSLDEAVDFQNAGRILGPDYCLMGNVNTTLMAMGGPKDVEEAMKEVIQKAGRNGFLLVCGGSLIADIFPPENIRAMVKATKDYGI